MEKLTNEEEQIREVILAARTLEEYLWGEYNGEWNIEEWRRMFRKRIQKIDDIDVNNHVNNAVYPVWASESLNRDFRLTHLPQEIEICFKKEALYGEKVEVRTKINESESFHLILDKNSGAELAECRFKWRELTSKP